MLKIKQTIKKSFIFNLLAASPLVLRDNNDASTL